MIEPIRSFLERRIEAGDIPGAAWVVAGREGILAEGAAGRATLVPESIPASTETIYDLASLTKPLVTSLLYLLLRDQLELGDDQPVRRVLPELDRIDKREVTIRHLLTHTSGMPAWVPFYLGGSTIKEYLAQMGEIPPEQEPGARVVYSCAGYIALGEILQRASTMPLDALAEETVWRRLGLSSTAYRPPASWLGRVAATEDSCHYERSLTGDRSMGFSGFRNGLIRGEVHDQNAWTLGGVAGNSGLFSTARECATIALEYLGAGLGILEGRALTQAGEDQTPSLNEARSYAFRIALRGETAAGPSLPPESFGHNGFTGTSLWIDPTGRRVYVLLTNRVHPRVDQSVDMLALRREFHALASTIA